MKLSYFTEKLTSKLCNYSVCTWKGRQHTVAHLSKRLSSKCRRAHEHWAGSRSPALIIMSKGRPHPAPSVLYPRCIFQCVYFCIHFCITWYTRIPAPIMKIWQRIFRRPAQIFFRWLPSSPSYNMGGANIWTDKQSRCLSEIFPEIIPPPALWPSVVDLLRWQKVTYGEAFSSAQNYSCYQLLRRG